MVKKMITAIAGVSIVGASAVLIATASTESAETVEEVQITTEAKKTPPRGAQERIRVHIAKEDQQLLQRIIMAEAESESITGKALVGRVILNRVESPSFPDTIQGVVFEEGQFTPVYNGRFDEVEPDDSCKAAVHLLTTGWDESRGATYFKATWDSSAWHDDNLTCLFSEGGHVFYK